MSSLTIKSQLPLFVQAMAVMCGIAYAAPRYRAALLDEVSRSMPGMRQVLDYSELGANRMYNRDEYYVVRWRANENVELYRHTCLSSNTTLIVLRGTRPTNQRDLTADVGILTSSTLGTDRFRLTRYVTEFVVAMNPYATESFMFTGHSLGGSLSLFCASRLGRPSFTFNPGGGQFPEEMLKQLNPQSGGGLPLPEHPFTWECLNANASRHSQECRDKECRQPAGQHFIFAHKNDVVAGSWMLGPVPPNVHRYLLHGSDNVLAAHDLRQFVHEPAFLAVLARVTGSKTKPRAHTASIPSGDLWQYSAMAGRKSRRHSARRITSRPAVRTKKHVAHRMRSQLLTDRRRHAP
jgi:hypothetical protein